MYMPTRSLQVEYKECRAAKMGGFMKNEGFKILIILFLSLSLMGLLAKILPINFDILLAIGLVGWGIYELWVLIRKLTFPFVYIKPNDEQDAMVSDYLEKIDEAGKKVKMNPIGVILVGISILLVFIIFDRGRMSLQFWIAGISAGVFFCLVNLGYYISKHRNMARFAEYKLTKVEFYNSSYIELYDRNKYIYKPIWGSSYENDIIIYYVFVRFNGRKMKLRVAPHVYRRVRAESYGVGYLVKYRNRPGIYDVYDFIPESRKRIRRE